MPSIFSKIIAGEIPGSFLYRDELVVAFLDIAPFTPGHSLVVPIKEISSFADLDEATSGRMLQVAGKIAKALPKTEIQCEGANLLLSDGETAGQEVPHAHLHVIPRYEGDGFSWNIPSKEADPSRDELNSIAESIKQKL